MFPIQGATGDDGFAIVVPENTRTGARILNGEQERRRQHEKDYHIVFLHDFVSLSCVY
nr:hypothetical protein [uncultured bacterium]